MIKVGDIKTNKSVAAASAPKPVAGSSFSSYLGGLSTADSRSVSATGGISAASTIFAAQMVEGEEERQIRKKLVKRSGSLLEKLEEIRNALLLGYISKDKIIEISRFVKEKSFNTEDQKLKQIMQEIELRVEVELAKLMQG